MGNNDPAQAGDVDGARDPFVDPAPSPRLATPLAVVAFGLAFATLLTGLGVVLGPVGMATGLIAHLKGSRLGIPASFASGGAMIAAMAFAMYMR